MTKKFDRGLDLGCGSSHVAIALKHRFPDRSRIGHLTQTDVAEEILTRARLRCGENDLPYDDFREVDEETIPFEDDTFDVVTSALSLHWVNDLPGTMVQINRVLKPDGVFMGALFGGELPPSPFASTLFYPFSGKKRTIGSSLLHPKSRANTVVYSTFATVDLNVKAIHYPNYGSPCN